MSTADSDLNVISVSIMKDIITPIFSVEKIDKLKNLIKVVNVIVGVISIWIALRFESVIDIVMFIAGFWIPSICVPMILALYQIVVQKVYMVLAAVCGSVAFILWHSFVKSSLHGVFCWYDFKYHYYDVGSL